VADDYGIQPQGFRLPERTRVGTVRLQVADLGRSLDYYGRVLGFEVRSEDSERAALGAQGGDHALIELVGRPGVQPVPRGGLLGLYHFAILLPDRAALGRFASHLATLSIHAGSADHAVSEAIYLSDPDGLGIEVYADRPRAAWRIDSTRQLFMTTAPLDVRGVIAAAGGAPWTGLPPGTTIGHVHLHVGDLAAAETFYHRALGFDKVVWNYPGALFLSAGGYHHHLGANTWSAGPPADERYARLLSWDLVLPGRADAEAAARSLAAAGHAPTVAAEAWTVTDHWGTPLRIVIEDPTPHASQEGKSL
jgi:catechol 2,3-dioxygenase